MMHNNNPFVSFFKHGIEVMAQHGAADIRMTIRVEGLPDPRRYTAPRLLLSCLRLFLLSCLRWFYRASSQQKHRPACPQQEW